MQTQQAVYPGAVPSHASVTLLFHTWNRRRSGRVVSMLGQVRMVDGEPADPNQLVQLLDLMYRADDLRFEAQPVLAVGLPLLAAPLWDAASRMARPRDLRPEQTLTCPATIRADLPLDKTTREFLGWQERVPLRPLVRLHRRHRAHVLMDLARLVALGALVPDHAAAAPPPDPLVHPKRLIADGQFGQAIDALVGVKGPDARALTGYAIYFDPDRPQAHRRTAGRMLLKAALRDGSSLAKELLPQLN